jgi:hypothetical protein
MSTWCTRRPQPVQRPEHIAPTLVACFGLVIAGSSVFI